MKKKPADTSYGILPGVPLNFIHYFIWAILLGIAVIGIYFGFK